MVMTMIFGVVGAVLIVVIAGLAYELGRQDAEPRQRVLQKRLVKVGEAVSHWEVALADDGCGWNGCCQDTGLIILGDIESALAASDPHVVPPGRGHS